MSHRDQEQGLSKTVLLESVGGLRAILKGVIIALVGVGVMVGPYLISVYVMNPMTLGVSLLFSVVGIPILLWAIYEGRDYARRTTFYSDRAEEWMSQKLIRRVVYGQDLKVSYLVWPGAITLRALNVRDASGTISISTTSATTTPGTRSLPSVAQIEELRDEIVAVVEETIERTLSAGQSYEVDSQWILRPDGVEVYGQFAPWNQVYLECDDETGTLVYCTPSERLRELVLTSDNAVPAARVSAHLATRAKSH